MKNLRGSVKVVAALAKAAHVVRSGASAVMRSRRQMPVRLALSVHHFVSCRGIFAAAKYCSVRSRFSKRRLVIDASAASLPKTCAISSWWSWAPALSEYFPAKTAVSERLSV